MDRSSELRDLADHPFSGLVSGAVVLTPDFAREIAAALDASPAAPPALDVERLARALVSAFPNGAFDLSQPSAATAIAVAYAEDGPVEYCEHLIPSRECRVVGCSGPITESEQRLLDGNR